MHWARLLLYQSYDHYKQQQTMHSYACDTTNSSSDADLQYVRDTVAVQYLPMRFGLKGRQKQARPYQAWLQVHT